MHSKQRFSFENDIIYQQALSFTKKIVILTRHEKTHTSWCEGLYLTATRLVRHIAEGIGLTHVKDKFHSLFRARSAAFECVPMIDLGCELGLFTIEIKKQLRAELVELCQHLTRLLKIFKSQLVSTQKAYLHKARNIRH